MKPILIHSEARAELDEAIAYYERQRQGLGLDLEAEVGQALRTIQENPELGAPYKATDYRFSVLRRFPTSFITWNCPKLSGLPPSPTDGGGRITGNGERSSNHHDVSA